MSQPAAFTITYWGTTGTFGNALLPGEVTDKVVAAIRQLVEGGNLQQLRAGPGLDDTIRALIEQELPLHVRSTYGGNTTCIEVQTPDALIIIDCGSGFRELGIALAARWKAQGDAADRTAHVLISHSHMDHTFGTPFFTPYYNRANTVSVWGPKVALDSLTAVLNPDSALSRIYFPPTYDLLQALNEFCPVTAGESWQIGSTHISTHGLNHPGGALAYRLENAGRIFVFATDHEHVVAPDPALADFARGADLLYIDGQYTRAEYEGREGIGDELPTSRQGWGHSTVEDCVKTAVAAEVRRLHIGHRDPNRGDQHTADFEAYLRRLIREELLHLSRPDGSCEAAVPHEGLRIVL